MNRLLENQVVGLSVGETTIDCAVASLTGGEAALRALRPLEARLLPAASASATLVFTHRGGLVMLRGSLYRAGGVEELRFAEGSRPSASAAVAEQRRRAARVDVALPAAVITLAHDGTPQGDAHQFVTRDVSLGGLALDTFRTPLLNGTLLHFTVRLPDATEIAGTGRVVRAAGDVCGVKFEHLAPADRMRLAGYLVGTQRARPSA